MAATFMNPEGLPTVDLYHQVSVTEGSRLVFVAGQVAVDRAGQPVGTEDLAAQIEQCYLNVDTALRAAGGAFRDVVKLTVYVVDWTPEKLPILADGIARAQERLGDDTAPPLTGIGVSALADPHHLVEVEATAVLA